MELRNSLSHYTFLFKDGMIYYYLDSSLTENSSLNLGEFMMKNKKQNLMIQSFLKALAEFAKNNT